MSISIIAHRGYSSKYPENTMLAFKAAQKAGADGIETDVQLSKDGVPVLIHDETLNRVAKVNGYVKDFTLKELIEINVGKGFGWRIRKAFIPTLEELLAWIAKTNLSLNIELKNSQFPYESMEAKVIKMVHHYKIADQTIYSSFNHESLLKINKIDSNAETAPLCKKLKTCSWQYIKTLGASGVHPNYKYLNKNDVKEMQKQNIKVRPYTVNQKMAIKRLIHWNIDGIITDQPRKAKRYVYEELKLKSKSYDKK
ncbi:glycerophosphodiester phosphodiesterase [Terrilactibacillus laevilacticus]|uniref:glycerophosphodiester phosphodiesterase n=1 Tax=Terrilactibacillus laevilacticus TaxID=1380157 RepID=UPI0011479B85|nr:glycerophosphodiester phosphodiesterase [Terrilactibacillus laevilacticus]